MYKNNGVDPRRAPNDRQAIADDGVLSTKMKQSTRNNNRIAAEGEESFIKSFE